MNIFEKSELVKPSLKLLNNGSMHKRGRETMDLKRLRDRISGKRRSFVPDVLCKGPKEVPVFTEMQLCFEKTEPFRLKSCSSKELNNRPKSCHENHTLYIPPLGKDSLIGWNVAQVSILFQIECANHKENWTNSIWLSIGFPVFVLSRAETNGRRKKPADGRTFETNSTFAECFLPA